MPADRQRDSEVEPTIIAGALLRSAHASTHSTAAMTTNAASWCRIRLRLSRLLVWIGWSRDRTGLSLSLWAGGAKGSRGTYWSPGKFGHHDVPAKPWLNSGSPAKPVRGGDRLIGRAPGPPVRPDRSR
jgi:hypothetical protein